MRAHTRLRRDGLRIIRKAIRSLADALFERLTQCWEQRGNYERLSAGAIAQAGEHFGRERARDRLESLYEAAIHS